MAAEVCRPVHGCSFGDERFLALIAEGGWDLLCHHAADVTNYKSPDFDTIAALGNNTHNLPAVLEALRAAGCRRLLLSGSVFEGGEGAGSQGLPDFSPYGLSKALTAQVFGTTVPAPALASASSSSPTRSAPMRSRGLPPISSRTGWPAPRPTAPAPPTSGTISTCHCWRKPTPGSPGGPDHRLCPDQSQRVRREPGCVHTPPGPGDAPRLGFPCPVELKKQVDFPEPRVRINTDPRTPMPWAGTSRPPGTRWPSTISEVIKDMNSIYIEISPALGAPSCKPADLPRTPCAGDP